MRSSGSVERAITRLRRATRQIGLKTSANPQRCWVVVQIEADTVSNDLKDRQIPIVLLSGDWVKEMECKGSFGSSARSQPCHVLSDAHDVT